MSSGSLTVDLDEACGARGHVDQPTASSASAFRAGAGAGPSEPHRVVDAVVRGQRPPQRRVAVLGVRHRGQGVAGHHGVHPTDDMAARGRVLPEPAGSISSMATVHTARIGSRWR